MGPTNWHLSTNDWAGYATAQWQLSKFAVFSAGLRWELEQMPPPIAALANPDLPLTEKLPSLGNNWGPRVSVAIGNARSRWPVLRLGYGMYYGRMENATIETALTQTGSLNGDLEFFHAALTTIANTAPAARRRFLTFLPASRQAWSSRERSGSRPTSAIRKFTRPWPPSSSRCRAHVQLTASAMLSLGRRLPVFIDTNFDPAVNPGTITAANPGITYTVCDEAPSGTNNGACGNLGLGPIKAATDHGSLLRVLALSRLPSGRPHGTRRPVWMAQPELSGNRPDHEQSEFDL